MLDLMRRKRRLKGVLWVVIFALAFSMLFLFIPGGNIDVGGSDSFAATVDGNEISIKEYVSAYRRLYDTYTDKGRKKVDPETIKAMGLGKIALDSLIQDRVILVAAREIGLDVSEQELRRAVETHPSLQGEGGKFIGKEQYKSLLSLNNISVTEFEDGMRQMLIAEKLRRVITDSIDVGEGDLREEFARTNIEAQARFVTFRKDDFVKRVALSESDLRSYFDAHKENYAVAERRKARYLLMPQASLAATQQATQQEIEEEWARQPHEDSVIASHILFAVKEPAQDAQIRARAEAVLKRVRDGEDFASLARQFSDDPGSKNQGGNLGEFQRGRMVKPFEDAAFALKPGEVSDLVRTDYGYHIIKMLQHIVPSMMENSGFLEQAIKLRKADEILKQKAQEADRLAQNQQDLEVIAKALNIPTEIKQTEFLARDADPIAAGISQGLLEEMFRLKEVQSIGKTVDHPLGNALAQLAEVQLSKPPDFTEARSRVERDCAAEKSLELMQAEAAKLAAEAKALGDLEKAARKFGVDVKTTAPFKRESIPDPAIGTVPGFNTAAFENDVGAVSAPITLEKGSRVAVLQVKSRTPFDEEAFKKEKDGIRDRLLSTRKSAYIGEFINRIKENLEKANKIRMNPRVIEEVELRY